MHLVRGVASAAAALLLCTAPLVAPHPQQQQRRGSNRPAATNSSNSSNQQQQQQQAGNPRNCPALLPGREGRATWQSPSYTTWVSARSADTSYGAQYAASVTPGDMSTVFTFDDIAVAGTNNNNNNNNDNNNKGGETTRRRSSSSGGSDAMCSLVFMLPRKEQLSRFASDWDMGPGSGSGPWGNFVFRRLEGGEGACVRGGDEEGGGGAAWSDLMPMAKPMRRGGGGPEEEEEESVAGVRVVAGRAGGGGKCEDGDEDGRGEEEEEDDQVTMLRSGNAYTLDVAPCEEIVGGCISAMISSDDTYFDFFQSSYDCPIGLFLIYS